MVCIKVYQDMAAFKIYQKLVDYQKMIYIKLYDKMFDIII